MCVEGMRGRNKEPPRDDTKKCKAKNNQNSPPLSPNTRTRVVARARVGHAHDDAAAAARAAAVERRAVPVLDGARDALDLVACAARPRILGVCRFLLDCDLGFGCFCVVVVLVVCACCARAIAKQKTRAPHPPVSDSAAMSVLGSWPKPQLP